MEDFQESFEGKVHSFMISNVEAFNYLTKEDPVPLELCPNSSDLYGDPLPLECLMRVPEEERRKRVLKLISPGHIVRGRVLMKTQVVLGLQVVSVVRGKITRSLKDLGIRGLVPVECMAMDRDKADALLEEMEVNDIVQGVVTGCREAQLSLSFRSDTGWQIPDGVLLGYLEDESSEKAEQADIMEDFLSNLTESPGFANPSSTENLKQALGIGGYASQTKPTLIRDMQKKEYLESDFSLSLRKTQRFKWSMETVAVAVKHFKEGNFDKAMGLFHHALDIDPKNVEGLVARGALYANKGRYRKAISDFEDALTENSAHRNARKFLVETRIAYGERLEEDGLWEEAAESYREAIADDGSQTVARERLKRVQEFLERKAAELLERERKEAAEKARIKKLHSIIEEEKKRKEKRDVFTVELRPSTKKEKKRKKKKTKKSKRRHYSTSEESLLSSESDYSRSPTPVRYKRKKKCNSRDIGHSGKHRGHRRHSRKSMSQSCSPLLEGRGRTHSVSPRQRSRKDRANRNSSVHSSSSEWSRSTSRHVKEGGRDRRDSSYLSSSCSPQKRRRKHRKSSSPVRARKRTVSPADRTDRRKYKKLRTHHSKSSHHQHSRRHHS